MGVGAEAKVVVGMLQLRLELIPQLGGAGGGGGDDDGGVGAEDDERGLTEEVVGAQMRAEKSRGTEKERLFLSYAKRWWREFLAIRPEHAQRIVKV